MLSLYRLQQRTRSHKLQGDTAKYNGIQLQDCMSTARQGIRHGKVWTGGVKREGEKKRRGEGRETRTRRADSNKNGILPIIFLQRAGVYIHKLVPTDRKGKVGGDI